MNLRKVASFLVGGAFLGLAWSGAAAAQSAPTFDQVLAAPDDPALNLAFAKSEANAGNLLSASAAMERLLIQTPGWSEARLYYAAILYRLDDLQGALEQLDLLDQAQLSPLQRSEARQLRQTIIDRRKTITTGGEVILGLGYDDNALGATVLQFDFPGAVVEDNGSSATVSARFNINAKVSGSGRISNFLTVGYFEKKGLSGLGDDFQRLDVGVGVAVENRMSSWRATLAARDYSVFGADYLSEASLRLEGTRRRDTANSIFGSVELTTQQFIEPGIDPFAAVIGGTHDGDLYALQAGYTRRISARQALTGVVSLDLKNATYDPFSYLGARVRATYNIQFDKAAYASLTAQYGQVDYKEPDAFLFNAERKDEVYRLRAALGAPLSYFSPAGATGDFRERILIEGAVTYDARNSNAFLADFDSLGAEIRLIARFGAR